MIIKKLKAKPVVVEGIIWTGKNFYTEIKPFTNGLTHLSSKGVLSIETTEGTITASIGDWILRGTHGEYYPVKPHVIEAKYDILDSN